VLLEIKLLQCNQTWSANSARQLCGSGMPYGTVYARDFISFTGGEEHFSDRLDREAIPVDLKMI
jgi:hypothetical protein